ncbi:sigma 54-interacting transcriptional regulator [Halobacteriovorax sp. GB3]|uniref:sigma 54-interacting transcriptional regulator n=1 Tax=Halobacteriovorax sp. GB3 TaxID=2719615 RepID=UPI00236192C6|nr:sigma 54-interacting transcriptional regulator [Halobacteriovorax sp. GB3]MDD0854479.1 sigma 54-interacting transcriptional regulator [Halobacteriovorax sp. GB3]
MINWQDMSNLHVISKLEEILNKWFGVEMIFTDMHYKIRSKHIEKDYSFKNHFFKVQMNMNHGYNLVTQDIEKAFDFLHDHSEKTYVFDSSFKHVKGVACRVAIEGEHLGTVMAFPFLLDTVTAEEESEVVAQMVELGATDTDAQTAVSHLKRMSHADVEYLQELVELVSDEIETFTTEISKREERIQELNSELGTKYRYHTMIGKSKQMQKIYQLLEKISSSESSVLINGENGTGKELVAKAVHYNSPRKDCQFLAVNCSAFNDNLLDSELFGHVKGAFTGAVKDKPGLFETANGGTLFLDEIGDTSLSMQVKLLRVLQEGTYMPVGADSPRRTDVRILAATNKDLKTMMAKGEFREDLYYRINVINVQLPPLRERNEDIPFLMEHFLKKRCDEVGMPMKSFSKKCMEKMLDYPWPGNVRELQNEVERLVVLAGDDKNITPDNLSQRILDHGAAPAVATRGVNTSGKLKDALEELEAMMIREGLKRCNFNKSKLAKELGVSRASLIMKVDKYGLDKRKKAAGE